jgi:hypothetical protein
MRGTAAYLAGLAAAAALAGPGAAAPATPAFEIKDAIARVTVVPEARSDIWVEVVRSNPQLPLKVRKGMGRTVIDGDLNGARIRSCRGSGTAVVVRLAGVGDIAYADMPQVVVHTPREVDATAGGAVFGVIGRAASVTLGSAGCGDWTLANVEGPLKATLAGSGDARAGRAGSAKLRVTGSGGITVADVAGRVDVDVAGSGGVRVASVAGPLDVHVAGAGDVNVLSGHATAMTVTVAGSGNVLFDGVADSLDARVAGSGDVRARQIRGPVKKSVLGSGRVSVGR